MKTLDEILAVVASQDGDKAAPEAQELFERHLPLYKECESNERLIDFIVAFAVNVVRHTEAQPEDYAVKMLWLFHAGLMCGIEMEKQETL